MVLLRAVRDRRVDRIVAAGQNWHDEAETGHYGVARGARNLLRPVLEIRVVAEKRLAEAIVEKETDNGRVNMIVYCGRYSKGDGLPSDYPGERHVIFVNELDAHNLRIAPAKRGRGRQEGQNFDVVAIPRSVDVVQAIVG